MRTRKEKGRHDEFMKPKIENQRRKRSPRRGHEAENREPGKKGSP
ncbi:hypothetical protein ACFWGC_04000 [Cytobacillus pseudoceanisediminis]|nr:hypothetical protein [Cytobacillus sp. Bac17]